MCGVGILEKDVEPHLCLSGSSLLSRSSLEFAGARMHAVLVVDCAFCASLTAALTALGMVSPVNFTLYYYSLRCLDVHFEGLQAMLLGAGHDVETVDNAGLAQVFNRRLLEDWVLVTAVEHAGAGPKIGRIIDGKTLMAKS